MRQHARSRLPHAEAMAVVDRVCAQAHALPSENQVLSWDELRALATDGVSLGAHTHSHAALTRLPLAEASAEITRSRDEIHEHTGIRPVAFAYPFGDHNREVAACARDAGFAFAVTCLDGPNYRGGDPMLLRRINITQRTTPGLFALRLTAAGMSFDRWRHRDQMRRPAPLNRPDVVRLAYVMSRFPKLSETFVVNEMSAMTRLGVPVELYPLMREAVTTVHPDVEHWMTRARYVSWLSPRLLSAHVRYLTTKPDTYLTLLAEVLRRNWGSRKLFVGALGTFPKAVQFADDAQRRGVTHVHAHFATHPALAAFVVQRLTGIPYSFTAHGSDLHVDRRMLDAKVGAARFVVAVSRFNRDIIVRECGDDAVQKVHVVHCGVDVGSFAPAAARVTAGHRMVCVASLEEVKGHRFLIEACALLRARGIEFLCELIGEGPMRGVIAAQIANAGLQRHVVLLGGKSRPEVISHLSGADIAVLASHPTASGKREGIPVALMEAMAVELPVVSTAISGIPELVEHGVSGLLVPSGDAAALADALQRLIGDDRLRRELGRAGRETILREFDLDANARTLLDLCRRQEAGAS
jgi:colanic acid/amylovoran biosynthesis glycosyltransferase